MKSCNIVHLRIPLFFLATAIFARVSGDVTANQPGPVPVSLDSNGGLQRATFRLPQGAIIANLPDDIAAGDTLSGTVIAEPSGNTPDEKVANGATLSGYVIEAENEKTPVHDRTAAWVIPAAAAAFTLILRDPSGREASRTSVPVAAQETAPPATTPTYEDFQLPTRSSPGGSVRATGPFTGDLRKTAISISGNAADILAESPRQAVFRVPATFTGVAPIELREGDLTITGTLRSLQVRLSATAVHLMRGQTSMLTIAVSGLAGITEPVDMTLINASPGVVRVAGSQLQKFQISPGEVSAAGVYAAQRVLTGVTQGAFDISAFVRDPPLDQFNLRRTTLHALAQWQYTTGIQIAPEAQSLIAKSVDEAKPELNRFFLAQSEQANPDWLTSALIRHYCFSLRDALRDGGHYVSRIAQRTPPFPFAQSFQTVSDAVVIGTQLVEKNTFVAFLRQLISSLSTSMEVGQLDVSSTPASARIAIDGKVFGYTFASFVVSAGNHNVVIAAAKKPCQRKVQVTANQTTATSCP